MAFKRNERYSVSEEHLKGKLNGIHSHFSAELPSLHPKMLFSPD